MRKLYFFPLLLLSSALSFALDNTYTKVTSASQLSVGDKVILTYTTESKNPEQPKKVVSGFNKSNNSETGAPSLSETESEWLVLTVYKFDSADSLFYLSFGSTSYLKCSNGKNGFKSTTTEKDATPFYKDSVPYLTIGGQGGNSNKYWAKFDLAHNGTGNADNYGFYNVSNRKTNGYSHFSVWKVEETAISTCPKPTNLVPNNRSVNLHQATVEWTAPATAPSGGYLVAYSTKSTAPGTDLTTTGASNGYTVAAVAAGTTSYTTADTLRSGTEYYWWVRSNCGGDDYSSWVAGDAFGTKCELTLIDNGTSRIVEAEYGKGYDLPDGSSTCEDATFLGWKFDTYEDHDTGTSTNPGKVTNPITPTSNATYTAVYSVTEEGGGGFTKMTSTDVLSAGDRIAIVPVDDTHALYQQTVSTSYVNYWIFDDSKIGDDDKNWLTVSDAGDGKWYLGDDTEGYLHHGGSNKLYVQTNNKSKWTIAWNSTGNGFTFNCGSYLCCRADLTGDNQYKYRCNGTSISSMNSGLYYFDIYRDGGTMLYTSNPSCCTAPETLLSLTAGTMELTGGGEVHLTVTGGNGKDITWETTGGTLSDKTNSGAVLTLPSASTTQTYTVTITQAKDDSNEENVICGATRKVTITVKAQHTITFKTKDNGTENTYSTVTVTDGESYQFPDLSEDYSCEENYSFAGWASSSDATSVGKTAGSSATATANATWWAVWMYSTSTQKETRDKYELVTDASTLAAEQVMVIGYANGGVVLKQMDDDDEYGSPVAVDFAADKSYLTFASGTEVMELKLLWHDDEENDDLDGWYFQDNNNALRALTYSGTQGGTLYYDDGGGWFWDITINATSKNVTISDTETGYTNYSLQYNSSNSKFAFYSSSQKKIQLYRKNGTVQVEVAGSGATYTTNNEHCNNGATIKAADDKWITAANGQKVKTTIQVTAKNFESAQTLTATSNNSNFRVSLASANVPASAEGLTTNLTVEYTPTSADITESATVTLTAGDVTKDITVNGRSLPDEFVIVTQKNGKWYALPANMKNGAGTYAGTEVTPDGAISQVPSAPTTAIYSLRSVATSRYDGNGDKVRLVGNDSKCLWATKTQNSTNIQNYAQLASTNGDQYEWLLTTTDGEIYKITLPVHPDTESGRQLAYGTEFGYYKSACEFYLLPVGCSSLPDNVQVSPRRVDATFSWESNAQQMQIEIIKDGSTIKTVNASSSPMFINELSELTEYTYRLTPDGSAACAYEGEFTTTGPTIDVVEWQENAVVIQVDVEDDQTVQVVIQGEKETGVDSKAATELFFAKYFEGAGSMKLISIFNGTRNDINLSEYTMEELHASSGTTTYGSSPTVYDLSKLGLIKAGQEIIFFTRPKNECAEQNLYSCSQTFLNQVAQNSDIDQNPRWIECDGNAFPSLLFNGNDAMLLKKSGTAVDVFGAATNPTNANVKNCRNTSNDVGWSGRVKNMDYGKQESDFSYITLSGSETLADYGINLTDEELEITTARCILFRAKVENGTAAVTSNTTNFSTFTPEEWNGRNVCVSQARCQKLGWTYTCGGSTYKDNSGATCNSYQDLGKFDYSSYYKDYKDIDTKVLSDFPKDAETHTYTVAIDNMKQYACLNLKFQIADKDNKENVLTEQEAQVPIIIPENTSKSTDDDLFKKVIASDQNPYNLYNESINRCKTCNVVVLSGGVLTKAADGTANDVNAIYNLKLYPGSKLVVPTSTNYNVNSLSFRRQEDAVSSADIQGQLNVTVSKGVYFDLRIDPSNWHYVALPFDVNVDDITFADGTPAQIGADYLIAWYDGAYRAAHKDGGWTDVVAGATLKKGFGYIVALPGSGKVKQELRFPMSKEVIADEKQNKTISGLYAYGGDKSEDDLRWNHRGWNMIGNPYLTYYNGSSITTPLLQGTLVEEKEDNVWTGYWNIDTSEGKNLRYVVAPIDNGWSGYTQQTIGDNLEPFTSYFVQIAGNNPEEAKGVEFTTANTKRSIVSRYVAEAEDDTPVWVGVELTNKNGEQDETALLVSNRFTDGYDAMDDLVKWRGTYYQYPQVTTRPVLASRNTEGEMAFNALPDSSARAGVPLNYYAATQGNYVISLSRKYPLTDVSGVWLYDNVEQTWTDLMLGNYQFTSARGDNKTRFTLSVRVRRQPKVTTDTEDLSGLSDLRVVCGDKRMAVHGVPDGAQVWVYDMTGKLVTWQTAAGQQPVTLQVPASGVYNVRVVNGEDGKTIKVSII